MPEFFPAPKDAQDLLLTKAASQFTGNRLPVSSVFKALLEITVMFIQNRNAIYKRNAKYLTRKQIAILL